MRLFLHRQIFGFRTVTVCVFWTLILRNPQPSDGVVPEGEYGTFTDHYGPNLEGLTVGDVFEKQGNGALLLVYSDKYYFQMHTGKITEDQREVSCHWYSYPVPGQAMRLLKKVRPVPNIEGTLGLVRLFREKYLPFHWNYCNKFDYMNYILYAQLRENNYEFKECPLTSPWNMVSLHHITDGYFRLMDSNDQFHDFSEYSLPRERRGDEPPAKRHRGESSSQARAPEPPNQVGAPDPPNQGRAPDSPNQVRIYSRQKNTSKYFGTVLSWEQLQASSFRRMISGNPFRARPQKRAKSV